MKKSIRKILGISDDRKVIHVLYAMLLLVSLILMNFHEEIFYLYFRDAYRDGLNYQNELGRYFLLSGGIGVLISFGYFILMYLRGDPILFRESPSHVSWDAKPSLSSDVRGKLDTELPRDFEQRFSKLENEISRLERDLDLKTRSIHPVTIKTLNETLVEKLSESLPSDILIKIKAEIAKGYSIDEVRDRLIAARSMLIGELESERKRGNVNLMLGVVTTFAALGVLFLNTTTTPPESADFTKLIAFYFPKIALAAFIELFSFFFLRMYRSGLTELKYFHSEILSIEFKVAALQTACRQGDNAIIAKVVDKMTDASRANDLHKNDSENSSIDAKTIANLVEAAINLGKKDAKS